jgi:hypothetical protein
MDTEYIESDYQTLINSPFYPGTRQAAIYVPGIIIKPEEGKSQDEEGKKQGIKDMWLVVLTGEFKTDFKGNGQNWARHDFSIYPNLKLGELQNWPIGKSFKVHDQAPLVTLNGIYNNGHAVNAGWRVENFSGPGASAILTDRARMRITIMVRDIDGCLLRIGYSLTMRGEAVQE